jgi:hypothetical protein
MSDTEVEKNHMDNDPERPVMRVELEVPQSVDLVLIINGVQIEFD